MYDKRKKYVILSLCCIMAIATLAGCGSSPESTTATDSESNTEVSESQETDAQSNSISENADYKNNMVFTEYGTDSGVIVLINNNNDIDVTVEANVTYYDDQQNMLSSDSNYLWDCAKNGTGSIVLEGPMDADYNRVDYDSFKIVYSVSDAHDNFSYDNLQSEIEITSNIGSDSGVTAEFTNNTGNTLDELDTMCVYFANDNAIGYTTEIVWDCAESASVSYAPPMDSNFNPIVYDNYEIYINGTVIYSE